MKRSGEFRWSRWWRPNRVFSDQGYFVELLRTGIEYVEADRKAVIGIEPLVGKLLFGVDADSPATWEPPFELERIDDDRRKQIRDRAKAALEARGYFGDWSPPEPFQPEKHLRLPG